MALSLFRSLETAAISCSAGMNCSDFPPARIPEPAITYLFGGTILAELEDHSPDPWASAITGLCKSCQQQCHASDSASFAHLREIAKYTQGAWCETGDLVKSC